MECSTCGTNMTLLLFSYVCDGCSEPKKDVQTRLTVPERGYVVEYHYSKRGIPGNGYSIPVFDRVAVAEAEAKINDSAGACEIHPFYSRSGITFSLHRSVRAYTVVPRKDYTGQDGTGFVKAY